MNFELINDVAVIVAAFLARNDMVIPTLISEVATSLTEVGEMPGNPDSPIRWRWSAEDHPVSDQTAGESSFAGSSVPGPTGAPSAGAGRAVPLLSQ